MDSKFRELVRNTKTQMDKDVQFLLDHGIDPSAKYSNIPMYYPAEDCLVVLRGPSKSSPYFNNNNIVSPEDTVIIQKVKEERVPSTQDSPNNNFYNKEYTDKIELTVDDYKNQIYNNEKNEETKAFLHLKDLDTPEEISSIQNQYNDRRQMSVDLKNSDFNSWIQRYGDEFDLDGLSEDQKTLALKRLYRKYEEGYDIEDLAKSNIVWQVRHQNIFKIFSDGLKQVKDEEKQKELKAEFARKQREWFKAGLNTPGALLKAMQEWMDSILNKKESVLTEFYPTNQDKPAPLKDLYEVKKVLVKLFGIDADRFITVPVIKKAVYSQDKAGNKKLESPEQQLKVISFPNQVEINRLIELLDKEDKTPEELAELGKLSNYSLVRVQDVASPSKESFLMNLKELGDLIKKPENKGTELDTVDFRLQSGNEFKTLNPGMGKFVDLPDEVVIEMLQTVNKENWEYEDIDLVKYYNAVKRTGKVNPLVTKALNEYNTTEGNYIVRCFNTADGVKFKGFIPNVENPRSKPSMAGKDTYKQLMK